MKKKSSNFKNLFVPDDPFIFSSHEFINLIFNFMLLSSKHNVLIKRILQQIFIEFKKGDKIC